MLFREGNRAIAAWVSAGEVRRARAAEAAGLTALYKAGAAGEAATARTWYGIGALAWRSFGILTTVQDALAPTVRDVMVEAGLGPSTNSAENAFGLGLMAESGASIVAVVDTWMTANAAWKDNAAKTVNGMLGKTLGDVVTEEETATTFYKLGYASMEKREALAEFFQALTGNAPRERAPMVAENVARYPWTVALNLRGAARTMEVIPPPRDGYLVGVDGRRFRVEDMAALAAAINAQATAPRVDFDHRTERSSRTFQGSTRAEGWLSNFRINARGGIDADMALGDMADAAIRHDTYRYLSPSLILDKGGNVIGLSSVALVNDPNFDLRVRAA